MPKTPQGWINEGLILITATTQVVTQQLKDEIITREEAVKYLAKLKKARSQLDEARELLDKGLSLQAEDKAKLAHNLTLILHRELAKKAREAK